MSPARALVFFRLAALLALCVSAALLVDYLRPEPAFCELGSGCDRVRRAVPPLFGLVPIPVVGVVSYASLLALSLVPRARALVAWAALFGAVAAVGLLGVQGAVIGAFCSLCVTVDLCAVAAGSFGFLARNADEADDEGRVGPLGWTALSLLAMGLPVAIGQARPSVPAPADVVALWKPGVVNVIELSDFECPFCRAAHPALEVAKKNAKHPVNFVRLTMPLPRHLHARDASRAWVCAGKQGKGDAMADMLFANEDLSIPGCEDLAKAVGCDVEKFRACVADKETEASVERDVQTVMRTDFKGLPTVWINETRLLGAQDAADYAAAIADAEIGKKRGAPKWWPLAFVLLAGLGLFGLGLRGPNRDKLPPPR